VIILNQNQKKQQNCNTNPTNFALFHPAILGNSGKRNWLASGFQRYRSTACIPALSFDQIEKVERKKTCHP